MSTLHFKQIIKAGLLCLLWPGLAFGRQSNTPKLSLKDAVETALKNNLQVQQSGFQQETSNVYLKQARANVFPDLIGNLGHGLNQGRSIDPFTNSYINQQVTYANYSLSSSVILFNGLQQKNAIRQADFNNEANKFDLQQVKDNLMLNVINAYVQVLNSEEQVSQARNQEAVTRQQVERLEILNKAGSVSPAQLYDLRGQLANDQLSIVNMLNQLNTARLTLCQFMNIPYTNDLSVEPFANVADEPDFKFDNPVEIYNTALKQLPMIRLYEARKGAALQGVKVARGTYLPTLALSGSINTNYSNAARRDVALNIVEVSTNDYVTVNGSKLPVVTQRTNVQTSKIPFDNQFKNNYSTSLFLSLRVPVFSNFRAKYQVALAKIEQRNSIVADQTIKTQLNQQVEQAYFSMTAAAERYKTLVRQVNDFTESFRIAEVRFNAGVITQVDYLVAKNNVDRSKINLIATKYDYLFRTRILDYYKGTLKL